MKILCFLAIILFGMPLIAFGRDDTISLDDLVQSAERWAKARSFHHSLFPAERIAAERQQSVSVCLPARECADTVGDIVAAEAGQLPVDIYEECCAIASANGFAPGESARKRSIGMLTAPGSTFAASMLRDIERGAPIEADHIVGDLLARGDARKSSVITGKHPLLHLAYAHLRTYEARRQREKAVPPQH